jgi:hypothetical protein
MNPFRNLGSLMHQAFEMALQGTSFEALQALAKKKGGDAYHLFTHLRAGRHKNFEWDVDERYGKFVIGRVRQSDMNGGGGSEEESQRCDGAPATEGSGTAGAAQATTQGQAGPQGEE